MWIQTTDLSSCVLCRHIPTHPSVPWWLCSSLGRRWCPLAPGRARPSCAPAEEGGGDKTEQRNRMMRGESSDCWGSTNSSVSLTGGAGGSTPSFFFFPHDSSSLCPPCHTNTGWRKRGRRKNREKGGRGGKEASIKQMQGSRPKTTGRGGQTHQIRLTEDFYLLLPNQKEGWNMGRITERHQERDSSDI